MATKKNNPLDDLDFDNLDFDKLNFGDDGQSGDKKRKASVKAASNFAKGVRDSFVNPSNIRSLAANALPRGYGTAMNTYDDLSRGVSGLYDAAAKELKPALPAMRRMTGRMLPHTQKVLPASIVKKLDEFAKKKDGYAGYSQEQADSDTISQSMSDIFKIQMEQTETARQEDKAEQRIERQVADMRLRTQSKILMGIQESTARLASYQDKITHKYQQKSLELQYRSYFVQRDTLKLMMGNGDRDKMMLEAIMKNTGMADVEKLRSRDRAGNMLKNKILGQVGNAANEYARTFVKKMFMNAAGHVASIVRPGSDGLMQADELGQMMEGMGPDASIMETVMQGMGGMAASFGQQAIGRILRPILAKNPKIAKMGNQAEHTLMNIPSLIREWASSDKGDNGKFGLFSRILKMFVPSFSFDTKMKGSKLMSLDEPAIFDKHVHTSIVEIIPGYLSKIHNEIAKMRTGNENLDPVLYNMDRGTFTSKTEVMKDIDRRMKDPYQQDVFRRRAEKVMETHNFDPNKLKPSTIDALKIQLRHDARNVDALEMKAEHLLDPNKKFDKLTWEQRQELAKAQGVDFFKNDPTKERKLKASVSRHDLRNSMPNEKAMLEGYHEAYGIGILQDGGYVTGDINKQMNTDPLDLSYAQYGGMSSEELSSYMKEHGYAQSDPRMRRAWLKLLAKTRRNAKGKLDWAFKRGRDGVRRASRMTPEELKRHASEAGVKIHGFASDVYGRAPEEFRTRAEGFGQRVNQTVSQARTRLKDIYTNLSNRLAIQSTRLQNGEYRDQITGNPIHSIDDINGPVVDLQGTVVLSAEDAAAGLHDQDGAPVEGIAEKIKTRVSGLTDQLRAKAGQTSAAVGNLFQSSAQGAGGPPPLPQQQQQVTDSDGALIQLGGQQVILLEGILNTLREGVEFRQGGPGGASTGYMGKFGTHLSKILGLVPKGAGLVKRYVTGAWGLMFKGATGAVKLAGQALRGAAGAFGFTKDYLTDVYDSKTKEVLLTAKGLREGQYFDKATGKVIQKFKDIKGAVVNAQDEIVVTDEQYKAGLITNRGKKIITGVMDLGGKLLGAVGAGLGVYGRIVKLGYTVINKTLDKATEIVKGLGNKQADVYVKGEKEPRLRGIVMKQSPPFYFNVNDNKPVRNIKDVMRGPVRDANGMILLSQEDFHKGIVDYRGKPFKGLGERLWGAAKWGMDWAVRGAKGYADLVWGAVGAIKNTALGVLGLPGRWRGQMDPKYWMGHSEKILAVLTQMRDILDQRLNPKKAVTGSWQDQDEKRAAKKKDKEQKDDDKKRDEEKGGWFSGGLAGFLKKLNPFGHDEDEEDEDGDDESLLEKAADAAQVGETVNDIRHGRRTRGERHRAAKQRLKGMRKKGIRMPRGKYGRLGRMGRLLGKTRAGRLLGRIPGVGGLGRGLARGGTMLGAGLGGGARLLGRAAGPLAGLIAAGFAAKDVMDIAHNDQMTSGQKQEGIGGAVGSGVGGFGGAMAGAAIGTMIAGPLGTLVGGAIGGFAGSKAGQWVGKQAVQGFHSWKDMLKAATNTSPLFKLRMTQYGVDVDDKTTVAKILKLERATQQHLYKTFPELYDLMEIGDSWFSNKKDQQQQFVNWVQARFMPVYQSWIGAMKANGLDPSQGFDETSGLKPEAINGFVESVYSGATSAYSIMLQPFSTKPSPCGPKEVEAAKNIALDSLKKEANGGNLSILGKLTKGVLGVSGLGLTMKATLDMTGIGKKLRANDGFQDWLHKQNGFIRGAAQAIGLEADQKQNSDRKAVAERLEKLQGLGGRVTALQAIRYKTYGLVKLDADRVDALYFLENNVLEDVTYNADNVAALDKSANFYWPKLATKFGLSMGDDDAKAKWTNWFDKRFVPTVLTFATAVKTENANADPLKADSVLKPDQQIKVANATLNSVYKHLLVMKTPVWQYTDSPWDNNLLNTDPKTTAENILALRNNAASTTKTYTEEAAKRLQQQQANGGAGASPQTPPSASQAGQANAQPYGAQGPDAQSYQGYSSGSAATGGSAGAGSIGQTVAMSEGTGGKIDQIPQVESYTEKGIYAAVAAAAKMVGVDAALLMQMAKVESSFGRAKWTNASSAKGIFQFISGTWNTMITKYARLFGLGTHVDPMDDRANILMGALFTRDNVKALQAKFGRMPTFTEVYAAHFLGLGGAFKLFSLAPGADASAAMPAAAKANRPIFFDKSGSPRTVAGVIAILAQKMGNGSATAATAAANDASAAKGGAIDFSNTISGYVSTEASQTPARAAKTASGVDPMFANTQSGSFTKQNQAPPAAASGSSTWLSSAWSGAKSVFSNAVMASPIGLAAQVASAMARGVTYGWGVKNSASGSVDCSGWIAEINTKMIRGLLGSAAGAVLKLFAGPASVIIQNFVNAGAQIVNKQALLAGGLKEGMIIGEDHGDSRSDQGRSNYLGIDHIVQCVKDPKTGALMITQSQSKKGVTLIPAQTYLNQRARSKALLFGVDAFGTIDRLTGGKFLAALNGGGAAVPQTADQAAPTAQATPSPSMTAAASMGMPAPSADQMTASSATASAVRGAYANDSVNTETKLVTTILQKQLDVQIEMRDLLKVISKQSPTTASADAVAPDKKEDSKAPPTTGGAMKRFLDNPVAGEVAQAAVSMLRKVAA